MAITQITQTKSRRGRQQDLPRLASGQFGWCIDTRRLYIGNGLHEEGAPELGNTEILSEFSSLQTMQGIGAYTFSGLVPGVNTAVQTTPSAANPIIRSMTEKLDDFANLRDFGGVGDASTNSVGIINHAIRELYNSAVASPHPAYRTLRLPAGTFTLTGDVVRLLPFVKLLGEGKNVTFIVQSDATQECVAKLFDADQNPNTALGSNGAHMPGNIELENLTLINTTAGDVLVIDTANDVLCKRVRFEGNHATPTSLTGRNSCIKILSTLGESSDIVFSRCDFSHSIFGFMAEAGARNVIIDGAVFSDLYRGITLGETASPTQPSSWKVFGSYFAHVTAEAILTNAAVDSITSSFNTFDDVGLATHVIDFGGNNSFSVSDVFIGRTSAITAVKLRGDKSFALLDGNKMQLGRQVTTGGVKVTLNDNQSTATTSAGLIGIVEDYLAPTIMDYTIIRGTNKRLGTMKISAIDSSSLVYVDDYVETGDVKVQLIPTMNVGNTAVELMYISAATSATATLITSTNTHL